MTITSSEIEEIANTTDLQIGQVQNDATMCRRLRSAGVDVNCGDEETTTEETTTETTTEETTTEEKDEESGFLVNGASLVLLLVSMAIFK